jgi:spore coat protein U-like protein
MRNLLAFSFMFLALILLREAHAGCSITTSTGIAFPGYDVFSGTDTDGQGSVTVRCNVGGPPPSNVVPVNVVITIGPSNTNGLIDPRQMMDPVSGDVLDYNVYPDLNRTIIWSNNPASPNTATLSNMYRNSPAVTTNVYGRIRHGQDVTGGGTYRDGATGLTVTINW